jgi:hypothetical protein
MSSKVTIIRSQNKSLVEGIHEFWEYRELLYMLMLRRITVRYKQTVIGIAWVLIQPLVAMTIFSIIFGNLVKIPSDGVPYPIFVYSALVLWGLFSEGVSRSGSSLLTEAQLITKVYFPRLIIPLAAVGSAWIDFVVSFTPSLYLWNAPRLGLTANTTSDDHDNGIGNRYWHDPCLAQCPLSRFPVHYSFFNTGMALCITSGLFCADRA